jgi:hypothetical protein
MVGGMGMGGSEGKEAVLFLKTRPKKLLDRGYAFGNVAGPTEKRFLVLFFKKELLSFLL